LPVNRVAVELVEYRKGGVLIATGYDIATPLLHFRSLDVIALENLYRVKQNELAELLLQLGRSLGKPPNGDSAGNWDDAVDDFNG
jgi:hypothetical protein